MEILITLLIVGLFIATSLAIYYGVQYKKLLNEYSELDVEFQKLKFEQISEKAKKRAIKKVLGKYNKEPWKNVKISGGVTLDIFVNLIFIW